MKRHRKLFLGLGFLALLPLAGCTADGDRYAGPSAYRQDSLVGDYLKARFAANQLQLDVAANAYASAARAAPQETLILRHAFFYELAAGNVDEAYDLARRLMMPEYRDEMTSEYADDVRPAFETARAQRTLSLPILTVAAAQMADGAYSEALETLKTENDSAYAQSITYLMEAWAVYELEGLEAGLARLEDTAGKAYTGFTPLHKALMLDAAGRTGEARSAFDAAVYEYATDQTRLARAEFLERTGNEAAALVAYHDMVAEEGTLYRAGRLGLIRLGEPLAGESQAMIAEAKRYRPRALVRNGADGAGLALYHFAWASYRQALQEQAAAFRVGFTGLQQLLNTPLAFAQLCRHLNPDFEAVNYLIGAIYTNYEMYDAAAETYARVSFDNSFYEYAVTDRASALVQAGDEHAAMGLLADYAAEDAYATSTALRLAGLQQEEGAVEAAEATLQQAISRIEKRPEEERGDELWRYYFSRGVLYAEMDRWVQAEADLVRARNLSGEEPYVLNYLGYSWVERGENLTEAFAMIETALSQEPRSGAITDSLGWAYYQLADYDKAIEYLERAVELEPADPVITDHLGDAYWKVGRYHEARYEWRRALSYEPEADLRAVIESKLAERQVAAAMAGDLRPE